MVRWIESRWLIVGTSSRRLVVGLLSGLPDLVSFITEDPSASLFFVNGSQRLTADRRLFLVQAALVSRSSEGVLQDLLQGPRVGST